MSVKVHELLICQSNGNFKNQLFFDSFLHSLGTKSAEKIYLKFLLRLKHFYFL